MIELTEKEVIHSMSLLAPEIALLIIKFGKVSMALLL